LQAEQSRRKEQSEKGREERRKAEEKRQERFREKWARYPAEILDEKISGLRDELKEHPELDAARTLLKRFENERARRRDIRRAQPVTDPRTWAEAVSMIKEARRDAENEDVPDLKRSLELVSHVHEWLERTASIENYDRCFRNLPLGVDSAMSSVGWTKSDVKQLMYYIKVDAEAGVARPTGYWEATINALESKQVRENLQVMAGETPLQSTSFYAESMALGTRLKYEAAIYAGVVFGPGLLAAGVELAPQVTWALTRAGVRIAPRATAWLGLNPNLAVGLVVGGAPLAVKAVTDPESLSWWDVYTLLELYQAHGADVNLQRSAAPPDAPATAGGAAIKPAPIAPVRPSGAAAKPPVNQPARPAATGSDIAEPVPAGPSKSFAPTAPSWPMRFFQKAVLSTTLSLSSVSAGGTQAPARPVPVMTVKSPSPGRAGLTPEPLPPKPATPSPVSTGDIVVPSAPSSPAPAAPAPLVTPDPTGGAVLPAPVAPVQSIAPIPSPEAKPKPEEKPKAKPKPEEKQKRKECTIQPDPFCPIWKPRLTARNQYWDRAYAYRTAHNMLERFDFNQNIAVLFYQRKGQPGGEIIRENVSGLHSEQRIYWVLENMGFNSDCEFTILGLFSERKPCQERCQTLVRQLCRFNKGVPFPVYFAIDYYNLPEGQKSEQHRHELIGSYLRAGYAL